jgi:hypothetical protein
MRGFEGLVGQAREEKKKPSRRSSQTEEDRKQSSKIPMDRGFSGSSKIGNLSEVPKRDQP